MKSVNDIQDQVIWDKANEEHRNLCRMYDELEALKIKHKEEIESFKMKIDNQELKVHKLCENRIKTIYDKETNRLLLDLR